MNTKAANMDRHILLRWIIPICIILVFIVILYPNLMVKKDSYQLGDVAERNIKAPKDFFVEDREATEEKRSNAVNAVLTVYDHDKQSLTRTAQTVAQAFALLKSIYSAAGKKTTTPARNPNAELTVGPLSDPAVDPETTPTIDQAIDQATELTVTTAAPKPSLDGQALQLKPDFEKMLGINFSDEEYKTLMKEKFSGTISGPVIHIYKEVQGNGIVANKELLLKELDRGITLRNIQTKTEQTEDSLRSFYGLDQAKTMVRIIGDPLLKDHGYQQRDLIVAMVQRLISPNITLNKSETEERKQKAASEIKTILYQIKAGEMILREGERVTPIQLKKINAMQSLTNEDQVFAGGLGAGLILACFMISIYMIHNNRHHTPDEEQLKHILLAGCLLVILMVMVKIALTFTETVALQGSLPDSSNAVYFGIPIATGSMLICLFLGLEGAMGFSLLAAVTVTVLFQNRFDMFIYYYLNSTLAAYWIQDCRERKVFIQAGVKLGFFNILLVTAISLYTTDLSVMHMLWNWAFAFLGGLGVGIITLGIAPLIELGFGFTTDITLLELANLEQPILKKLMIEAPGTYHHSIIVGSLVEAAAAEIGANPLLAKVCAYYHDIGKINKPLYFIENQRDGKNRHDKLAPSMSSLILISHIKHGVEIASENKLGKQIIDAIRQHHGTSLIQYFYDRAKQQKGEDAVNIDDYRYPGPKPQTREAGLVMLADVVEAASRTLDVPTPARIQGLVQNLINKIFSDGQLDNCELTLKDLHNIAKSFNKILNGIYHHRVEYSESPTLGNGKGKDASSDRQPAKQENGKPDENRANGTGHLKRLGLS